MAQHLRIGRWAVGLLPPPSPFDKGKALVVWSGHRRIFSLTFTYERNPW
jgi:hypothetical protein